MSEKPIPANSSKRNKTLTLGIGIFTSDFTEWSEFISFCFCVSFLLDLQSRVNTPLPSARFLKKFSACRGHSSPSAQHQGCHTLHWHIPRLRTCHFLLLLHLVLPCLLTFPLSASSRIVNADLVCAMRPAWVFISSCHILAASIISHCKAIRVLITRRVRRRGYPSTCLAHGAHANSGGRASFLGHTCRCPTAALYNELIQSRNDSSPAEAALDVSWCDCRFWLQAVAQVI